MNKKKIMTIILLVSAIVISNGVYKPLISYSAVKTIDNINTERDEVLSKIKEVEAETKKLQDEINNSQKIIDESIRKEHQLKKENEKLEEDIEELNIERSEKYDIMRTLIKMQYEQKNDGYISLLLESKSFANFLTRLEVINKIVKNNNYLIDELKSIEVDLEEKSLKIENQINEINEQKIIQEKYKSDFESLANERDAERNQLVKMQNELEDEISELQRNLAISSNSVGSNSGSYNGGSMAWPVPGYNNISSYYGYRIHPISGENKLHKGIDIPAPEGQSVVAANSGIVTLAGYNTSYGNLVVIDHGDGILTYYAHNSTINVSVGQSVSKGENIANIGATGYATGNSLHFEVQVNGSFVDPMNYLN